MKVEDLLIAGIPLGALFLTKFASKQLAVTPFASSITKPPGGTITLACNVTNTGNVEIGDLGLKPVLTGPTTIIGPEWDSHYTLKVGETISVSYKFPLPSDAPPGNYSFSIVARDISDNTSLGTFSTDWTVTIQTVKSISISNVSLS